MILGIVITSSFVSNFYNVIFLCSKLKLLALFMAQDVIIGYHFADDIYKRSLFKEK